MAQIGKAATRDARSVRPGAAQMTLFLESMAESSNVAASARAAEVTGNAMYRERRRRTGFSPGRHEALCEGIARLTMSTCRSGGQEAWRITLSPPVPGFAPWERTSPDLHIAAAALAALPPDTMIPIRQVGDVGLSLALSLSMPRSKAGR